MAQTYRTRNKTRSIAVAGLLAALCLILGFTPLGFIPIGAIRLTIIHIPVIIGALLEGPIVGLSLGLVFGGMSMFQAFTTPTSPLSIAFQNPLVSILPRLIVPLAAWGACRLTNALAGKLKIKRASFLQGVAGDAMGAIVGTLANTVLVLGAIYLVYAPQLAESMAVDLSAAGQTIGALLITIGVTNGVPEVIGAAAITVPVLRALRAAVYRNRTPIKK